MKKLFSNDYYGWNEIEEGILQVKSRLAIGVCGIGKGAGATFTAFNLAGILSDRYEGEVSYVSDRKSMPEIMGKLKNRKRFFRRLMLVDSPQEPKKMDMIICVIDPLPSVIKENVEEYRAMRTMEKEGMKVIWLLNKDNTGVDRRELERFLKLQFTYVQDMISPDVIYANEYASGVLFRHIRLTGLEILADDLMGQ